MSVPFARRMPECALVCPDARLCWLSARSASSRCESQRLIALWNDDQLSVLSRPRRLPKVPREASIWSQEHLVWLNLSAQQAPGQRLGWRPVSAGLDLTSTCNFHHQ
ncbi:hypothetical protein J3458_009498 [Metarhizium acridum]|uniref:uncharacterized protein n=1 Tax=Metarhizium acridum TaxID=92637 RepID=UPI001C6CB26C|nr:hypothetical protein J3458_009498 [Metarhizium acridum]